MLGAGISGLATLLLAALIAQPAAAHMVESRSQVVHAGNGAHTVCVISKAQLTADHTTGGMTPGAFTTGRRSGGSSCDVIDVFQPGHVAVRTDLQSWTGSSWVTCQAGGWVTNPDWGWEAMVSTPNATSPCGRTHYRTVATSMVFDGTSWQGGSIESPSHPPVGP
jgi:hypothetical protein